MRAQALLPPLDTLLLLPPTVTLGSSSLELFDHLVFLPTPACIFQPSEDSLSCESDVQLGFFFFKT